MSFTRTVFPTGLAAVIAVSSLRSGAREGCPHAAMASALSHTVAFGPRSALRQRLAGRLQGLERLTIDLARGAHAAQRRAAHLHQHVKAVGLRLRALRLGGLVTVLEELAGLGQERRARAIADA